MKHKLAGHVIFTIIEVLKRRIIRVVELIVWLREMLQGFTLYTSKQKSLLLQI